MASRLDAARAAGLDLSGSALLYGPPAGTDLSAFGAPRVIHPLKPDHDHWRAAGLDVSPAPSGDADLAYVWLPRAKAQALGWIADASRRAARVVVEGHKDHGVASALAAARREVDVTGCVSKAHGKVFWFSGQLLADWSLAPRQLPGGVWTAPGVFSAEGLDDGSAALISRLPDRLGPVVADLGAGWGALSAELLKRPGVGALHLVEAFHTALDCARRNIGDSRAVFHWADVRGWSAPERVDTVVMNPPFHSERAADPGLGHAFIEAAHRILAPQGRLLLVANRHLPYESLLGRLFRKVVDLGQDARFKVYMAHTPSKGG